MPLLGVPGNVKTYPITFESVRPEPTYRVVSVSYFLLLRLQIKDLRTTFLAIFNRIADFLIKEVV